LTRHCLKRQVAPCTRRIATRRKGQRAGRGIRYPPVCNLVDAALVAQKTVHKLTAAGHAKRQRLLLVFAIEVSDLDAEKHARLDRKHGRGNGAIGLLVVQGQIAPAGAGLHLLRFDPTLRIAHPYSCAHPAERDRHREFREAQ
jgi:hypothetical protein